MSEAINLKSCPFCGGEAEMKKLGIICDEGYGVVCSKCKARTTLFFVSKADAEPEVLRERTMKLAADKWNTRAGESNG